MNNQASYKTLSNTVKMRRIVQALGAMALVAGTATAGATDRNLPLPTHNDPRLHVAYKSERIWNGMAVAPDGTTFFIFTGGDKPGMRVAKQGADGVRHAFPDASWNNWKPGDDATHAFVHTNAVRIGPDGDLWLVDSGSVGPGHPTIKGAARVFRYDPKTDTLLHEYSLSAGVVDGSFIDDIRFNGKHAYLTDAGKAALLVLDLDSGEVRRVLADHPSTQEQVPILADHHGVFDGKGVAHTVQVDQLEVTPDGAYLYYQPLSGPMSRIGTQWLDDASLTPEQLASHVEPWLDTPSTGGTAIDANGNLYLSDSNNQRILKITPEKKISTLVADTRLNWPDAMWLDAKGNLFIPATQTSLTPGFNHGKMAVKYPILMLRMHVDGVPAKNDHP